MVNMAVGGPGGRGGRLYGDYSEGALSCVLLERVWWAGRVWRDGEVVIVLVWCGAKCVVWWWARECGSIS